MKVLKSGRRVDLQIVKTEKGYDVRIVLGSQRFLFGTTGKALLEWADCILRNVDEEPPERPAAESQCQTQP